ncbi:phosphonate C-P lyase system protein PhnH [Burkholderia sp. TSV86]|uniref:phosphonate C-P lyase system protein PhnH n=1 Tax=Burkholderia sp. TSV86 TaxID=1385594 RepID=UPI00075514F9|nr:phosphonate C-P lyase system protein PhnH [Burkholderia sp. TSV86]KVE39846.1 carbon-phosphorus lyase subunit PhnH [Burkholderia sp. TSV86]
MTMADTLISLTDVALGFADPVHDTQRAFRALLDALARPGTTGRVALARADASRPVRAAPAAFAALLALCDDSTPVFLGTPDAALASALRFHTGAPVVDDPSAAQFAYVDDPATLLPLRRFSSGAALAPEQAVTLFVRVASLTGGTPLALRGPGIRHTCTIAPAGLPAAFWRERAEFAPHFPCGIDCYLVCGDACIGLPRTTHVEAH